MMKNKYSCLNVNTKSRITRYIPERSDINKRNLKKKRLCLKCGKMFLSTGPYNRLCENCVSSNRRIALKTFYINPKHLEGVDH